MAFIDDLSTFVNKTKIDITKKTKQISFSLSNPEIRGKERELSDLYRELGEKYYSRKIRVGEELNEENTMDDLVSRVTEVKEELEALEKAAQEAGKKTCPGCGEKVPVSSKFCPECGFKMEDAEMCPSCGAAISSDMTFCVNCGTKIERKQDSDGSNKNFEDNGENNLEINPSPGTDLETDIQEVEPMATIEEENNGHE